MNSLERFWHWYENEKPPFEMACEKARRHLDSAALRALNLSRAELERHLGGLAFDEHRHAAALRRLSVSVLSALEELSAATTGDPLDATPERTPARPTARGARWHRATGAGAVRWRR